METTDTLERLVQELTLLTKESPQLALTRALEERLERVKREQATQAKQVRAERLDEELWGY